MKYIFAFIAAMFVMASNAYAGKTVLVVYEAASTRQAIREPLVTNGFMMIEIINSADAMGKILGHKARELIITGMNFGQSDVGQLIASLRSSPLYAGTPIIAVTADSNPGSLAKIKGAGANSYLALPFRSDTLLQIVRSLIGQWC
jgi:two-component system chemotaxis response regulator CheY